MWISPGADRLDTRRVSGLLVGFVGVAALLGLDGSGTDAGAVAEVAGVTLGSTSRSPPEPRWGSR